MKTEIQLVISIVWYVLVIKMCVTLYLETEKLLRSDVFLLEVLCVLLHVVVAPE